MGPFGQLQLFFSDFPGLRKSVGGFLLKYFFNSEDLMQVVSLWAKRKDRNCNNNSSSNNDNNNNSE